MKPKPASGSSEGSQTDVRDVKLQSVSYQRELNPERIIYDPRPLLITWLVPSHALTEKAVGRSSALRQVIAVFS